MHGECAEISGSSIHLLWWWWWWNTRWLSSAFTFLFNERDVHRVRFRRLYCFLVAIITHNLIVGGSPGFHHGCCSGKASLSSGQHVRLQSGRQMTQCGTRDSRQWRRRCSTRPAWNRLAITGTGNESDNSRSTVEVQFVDTRVPRLRLTMTGNGEVS